MSVSREEELAYLRARLVYAAGQREVALGKADLARVTMRGIAANEAVRDLMDLFDMRKREVELLQSIIEHVEKSEVPF